MTATEVARDWRLAPSALTFLLDSCPRCFKNAATGQGKRPSAPFPGIFSKIAGAQSSFFLGKPAQILDAGMPRGVIVMAEQPVRSMPLAVPGHRDTISINGRLDFALALGDDTFGIGDFKVSSLKDDLAGKYWPQLQGYAAAVINPAPGFPRLDPISKLGLSVFEPTTFVNLGWRNFALRFKNTWIDVPYDPSGFLDFLGNVLDILEAPGLPPPSRSCSFCRFLTDNGVELN